MEVIKKDTRVTRSFDCSCNADFSQLQVTKTDLGRAAMVADCSYSF